MTRTTTAAGRGPGRGSVSRGGHRRRDVPLSTPLAASAARSDQG